MAFVAPAVPWIIAGLSAAGTVYGAVEQKRAANSEAKDLLRQAKAEELSSAQQQINRRRNLLRALSSQNAAAGAAGLELGGSVSAIAKADIRDATNDLLIDKNNSQEYRKSLRSQARSTRRVGNAQFANSLFKAAGGLYKAGGGSTGGGGGDGGFSGSSAQAASAGGG